MLSLLTRFLVVLALACAGLVLTQAPAFACKCDVPSVQEAANRADVVFSGAVRDSTRERAGSRDNGRDVYRVEADTVYQGDVGTARVDVVSPLTSCGLGALKANQDYVFFVAARGSELRADQCDGSGRASQARISEVEDVLGQGKTFGSAAPSTDVSFTPVDDAAPQSLTRAAAPGAALVLIGLLGLLVVRRASRS